MNAIEQIEEQLRASVAALSPAERAKPTPPVANRRFTFPRALSLAAAAVAAAIVVAFGVSSSGPAAGPQTAAAAMLRHLAQIAAHGPSLVPGRGQYLYDDSVSDNPYYSSIQAIRSGTGCLAYERVHRQLWVSADGSGLLRESAAAVTFTSEHDRSVCLHRLSKSQRSAGISNMWFADRCFTLGPTDNMAALSTDPRTLLVQMRRIDGGPRTAAEDFVHVGDFLRETDADPKLRAALYRAAALIPGVKLLGSVRTHDGRKGLGIAYGDRGETSELIFDPGTAALIGEQSAGERPGWWVVYLRTRVVDRVPYPSPRPLKPACIGTEGRAVKVPGGVVVTGAGVR